MNNDRKERKKIKRKYPEPRSLPWLKSRDLCWQQLMKRQTMLCCKKENKEHIFIITTSQGKKKSSILNTQLYNTNVVFTRQKESHIRFMSLKIHLFTGNSIMYIIHNIKICTGNCTTRSKLSMTFL